MDKDDSTVVNNFVPPSPRALHIKLLVYSSIIELGFRCLNVAIVLTQA